jgi:peptidyl-prolyl cis-trans isomerase SurA
MQKYIQIAGMLMMLPLTAVMAVAKDFPAAAEPDSVLIQESRSSVPESSVVDEVIWVVGDEPIFKSDVEAIRAQSDAEGVKWRGNPDCSIPEQIAVQKLFLHQAAIDSIEVSESEIVQNVDEQINNWIQIAGSQEKLEEYRKQKISQMRLSMHDDFKKNLLVQEMKKKLVGDITVSPAEVRAYFKKVPVDSVPFVPTEVEVQIITMKPSIPAGEIN